MYCMSEAVSYLSLTHSHLLTPAGLDIVDLVPEV